MTDDEKGDTGFVVKDRRRFDSQGNERSSSNESQSQPKAAVIEPQKKQETEEPQMKNESKGAPNAKEVLNEQDSQEMNFSSFVMSLATQALMQLGEIKAPPGMQIEVDKQAARQTIDILGMLQTKTKGNLDAEETHLIEQILHNLRLSYVKVVV